MFNMLSSDSARITATPVEARPLTTRRVRSLVAVFRSEDVPSLSLAALPDHRVMHSRSADRRIELAYVDHSAATPAISLEERFTLLLGDDAEWMASRGRSAMGGAAVIEWDPMTRSMHVLGSIVALPPVFILRLPGVIAIASELHLLSTIAGPRLHIDERAVIELFTVGYPLWHRTLFREIVILPGGHELRIDAHGSARTTTSWQPPNPVPASPAARCEMQFDAFQRAVHRLHLADSVFSLTAGLDTRAILAVLAEARTQISACTLTGGRAPCLDARGASALSGHYGLPHTVVPLDAEFLRELPTYTQAAARLSGGLASLDQAHEIYFYRHIEGLGSRRLCGNLGNQLGRQGVEAASSRNADIAVLSGDLRIAAGPNLDPTHAREHWLTLASRSSEQPLLRSLLQLEAPFSSIGNYAIGHHFMTQQSPYTDRELIEISLSVGIDNLAHQRFAPTHAQVRDLRHRFLGPARATSFQIRAIARAGGFAASCPINWGWRARGGVSVSGLIWGILAFADALTPHGSGIPKRKPKRITGLHEIKPCSLWFDTALREFANDHLRSVSLRSTGWFAPAVLNRLLDEHFSGAKPHYSTLLPILNLALLQKLLLAPQAMAHHHHGVVGLSPK